MDINALKLYAITDRAWLKEGETLAHAVRLAILGGASIVQLREKTLKGEELKSLALEVQDVCKDMGALFVINDDVELAKEIDADGVHVGQSDMAVSEARRILGPGKIVGATAKTVEQAILAQREGADYLGSGAIFGTSTKKDALPMTPELLTEICNSVEIPVVAIGGIDGSNVEKLKGLPIAGVAVVSGIFANDNIVKAAATIKHSLFSTPVIQCITNHVTVNSVANILLTLGFSPIMAHNINEVEEVQKSAAGLLLNLGATDSYDAMLVAAKTANEMGHPVVIDPVGVAGIEFRRDFLKKLLAVCKPTCIRGNFAEIKAIYSDTSTMTGLDCSGLPDEEVVKALAEKLGCIIACSGPVDIISDGSKVYRVASGHKLQKSVTGSGCMLSAAIAGFLSDSFLPLAGQVALVCQLVGDCAKMAGTRTLEEKKGPMYFYQEWMDDMYNYC